MFFSGIKHKRIFCFMLCIVILISNFNVLSVFAEDDIASAENEISEYCNLNYELCATSTAGKLYVHNKSGRFYYEDAMNGFDIF